MIFQVFLKETLSIRNYFQKILVQIKLCTKFAPSIILLAHGVTGNTLVFGTKESRFEP